MALYVRDNLEVQVLLQGPLNLEFTLVAVNNAHSKLFIGLLD